MVPFFGGRSTLWSAWCPRPSLDDKDGEVKDWPASVIEVMKSEGFFDRAEKLLNVVPSEKLDKDAPEQHRIFAKLQSHVFELMKNDKVANVTRVIPAPLAVGSPEDFRLDFCKFSVIGNFLSLVRADMDAVAQNTKKERQLRIATDCVVTKIVRQDGTATALETSRGVLPLGKAKVILAMGCMPAATLLLNSFPEKLPSRLPFSAHFISAIVARIPRKVIFGGDVKLNSLELGAIYVAGLSPTNKRQFHIQMSVISDQQPDKNAATAQRYMPDVIATASPQQLSTSQEHVVFVLAVLGELDVSDKHNFFELNRHTGGSDPTANCTLHWKLNDKDLKLWDEMDEAAFKTLEALAKDPKNLEYWPVITNDVNAGWSAHRPSHKLRRAPVRRTLQCIFFCFFLCPHASADALIVGYGARVLRASLRKRSAARRETQEYRKRLRDGFFALAHGGKLERTFCAM